MLKRADMLDCLQLVHCHPGSQLQDIRRVKDSINELAHVYAELKIMGAGLQYIDVGGGLGVDYDGSGTNFESSMNYTLNEYANDVVYRIASVCDARDIPHPMIISESGRAIAAHHSVLIFNTLGYSALDKFRVAGRRGEDYNGDHDIPQPVQDLFEAYRTVSERRLVECYHDALQAREQALQMFNLGYLSLEFRGLAERLYWATCAKVRDYCRKLDVSRRSSMSLESDSERHLFLQFLRIPVAPRQLGDRPAVSDHADPPAERASDAQRRAGRYHLRLRRQDRPLREPRDVKRTLELHELSPGRTTILAAFLVGAYQETLGDLHNLFGDTHVVHIRLHDEGGWWIEEIVKGDTANRVLEYMEYDVAELHPKLSRDCERAVREGTPDACREPGAQALLRRRAQRIRLSRADGRTAKLRHPWTSRAWRRFLAPCSSPSSATRRSSRPCCLRPRTRSRKVAGVRRRRAGHWCWRAPSACWPAVSSPSTSTRDSSHASPGSASS